MIMINDTIDYSKIYKLSKYYHKIKNSYFNQNYKKKINLYMKHLKFHIGGNNNTNYKILDTLINHLNDTIKNINFIDSNDLENINKLNNNIEKKLKTVELIFDKKNEEIYKQKIIYSNILGEIKELLENIIKDKDIINIFEQEKNQKINEINELIKKNNESYERINSFRDKLYVDDTMKNETDFDKRTNALKKIIDVIKARIESNKEYIAKKQNEIKELDEKINTINDETQMKLKHKINELKLNDVNELNSLIKIIFQSLFTIIYSKDIAEKIINNV